MSYEAIVSPVAEFFGINPYSALEGRTGPRATKANALDKIFGITDSELKEAKKVTDQYNTTERFKRELEQRGIEAPKNLSGAEYQKLINKYDAEQPGSPQNIYRMQLEDRKERRQQRLDELNFRRDQRNLDREVRMMELNQSNNRRKAELFQALFGLGSAFMI